MKYNIDVYNTEVQERGFKTIGWIVLVEGSVQRLQWAFPSCRRREFHDRLSNYQLLKEDIPYKVGLLIISYGVA
jgi:hypothetical protein